MQTFYSLKEDEKAEIITAISHLLNENRNIDFAYIHGSFVNANYFRDIDIGVFVREDSNQELVKGLERELSIELTKALNYECDVKIINDTPILFQFTVLKGKQILCKNRAVLAQFKEQVYHKYLDSKPIREQFFDK
ncbi:MAG: nucleotidyltransferase domain-containing protein [Candidatus Heimdallarchaeaceae archaeon]